MNHGQDTITRINFVIEKIVIQFVDLGGRLQYLPPDTIECLKKLKATGTEAITGINPKVLRHRDSIKMMGAKFPTNMPAFFQINMIAAFGRFDTDGV